MMKRKSGNISAGKSQGAKKTINSPFSSDNEAPITKPAE